MRAFLFVLVILGSQVAAAQTDTRVAVVRLEGLGVDDAMLDKLDSAVRKELTQLGVDVATRDDVADAVKKAAHGNASCEGDEQCLIAVGAAVGATGVVTGSAGLAGDELHLTLKAFDVALKSQRKAVDTTAPADQSERRMKETVLKLMAPDRYNTSGAIALVTPLSGADIVVDGVPRGTTPLFGPVAVSPGRREVEVRYPNTAAWRGFVDVEFDEPYTLEIESKDGNLVQVPHGTTSVVGPSTSTKPPESIPTLTLVGAGVGVAGVLALIGSAAAFGSAQDGFDKFRADPSKAALDQNRTMTTAYGILLPVGLASLLAGAGLLVFSMVE